MSNNLLQIGQDNIIGKRICVSITHFSDYSGSPESAFRNVLNFGIVETANNELIEYRLIDSSEELFAIPAFYSEFHLPETDVVYYLNKVTNAVEVPDLIVTFNVYPETNEIESQESNIS
jgi:hypothetical protein